MSLDQRDVLRHRTYDGINGRWSPWTTIFFGGDDDTPSTYEYPFPDGKSKLSVETNTLSVNEQDTLAEELRNCGLFRQYFMQGSPEPRLQFLLNSQATENFDDPQPGYKYARGIRLKSRPLQSLEQVHNLSNRLERAYRDQMFDIPGQPFGWNIGVHCVLYRNGRDRMGYHADDDQGESLIVAVIVSCPRGSFRRVHIRPADRDRVGPQHGDVEIMLHLQAGDSYAMNGSYLYYEGNSVDIPLSDSLCRLSFLRAGEMQKHYFHGVPSDARSMGEPVAVDDQVDLSRNQRMAIVFRRGLFKKQTVDSGQAVESLAPRVIIPYIFGGSNVIPQMREGYIFIRSELFSCHAHR
jgi:2OG-Fe(II) oxygenase superfamily